MIIQPLDSADNKTIRHIKRLVDSAHARRRHQETVLEGYRLVEDALGAHVYPSVIVYSPKWVEKQEGRSFLGRLQALSIRLLYVTDRLLQEISQVQTHQGILAVVKAPQPWSLQRVIAEHQPPLFLPIGAEVQDPGNLGTLIRAALAAGCPAFGVTSGTVDAFNPKCVRASAGAVFRLPIVALTDGWLEELQAADVRPRMAVPEGGRPYYEADWTIPTAVVLGNEGAGITKTWLSHAELVTIPMSPACESINVAMAGSVVMFHVAYQRAQAGIGFSPPFMV